MTGCFIATKKKNVVYVSPLELGYAQHHSTITPVKAMQKTFFKDIKPHLGKKVGLHLHFLPHTFVSQFKKQTKKSFCDASPLIEQLRTVKDTTEISTIKKACAITDSLFTAIFSHAHTFRTELALQTFIRKTMLDHGVRESFPTIVASGKNGATPHHTSGNNKLKGMTVIDMGVVYKGYCSDLTRTLYFGTPTQKELLTYGKVHDVQEACIAMVKDGVNYGKIQEYAREKLGKYYIHGIGHGLGIDVHEYIRPKKDTILHTGNVITIEPGLYFPGKYGIRIEDDVVVGNTKVTVLSHTPRSLLIVK